jgi:hypothetical protein
MENRLVERVGDLVDDGLQPDMSMWWGPSSCQEVPNNRVKVIVERGK